MMSPIAYPQMKRYQYNIALYRQHRIRRLPGQPHPAEPTPYYLWYRSRGIYWQAPYSRYHLRHRSYVAVYCYH